MPASERFVRLSLSLSRYLSRLRIIVLIGLIFGVGPAFGVGLEGLKLLLRLTSGSYKEKQVGKGYHRVDHGDKTHNAPANKSNKGG